MVLLGWWSLVGCSECPDTTTAGADADRCVLAATNTDATAPPPDPVDAGVTESLAIAPTMIDLLVVVDSTHSRSPDVLASLRGQLVDLGQHLDDRGLDVHYGLVDSLGGLEDQGLGLIGTITSDPLVLVDALDTLPTARDSGFIRSTIYRALELEADHNAGFRRADASLEVLVASPRDDRSTAPNPSEFVSWLVNDPRRGGTAHGILPPMARATLDFVDESAGQHAWPFDVEPPQDWVPDEPQNREPEEPWMPPATEFDVDTLVADNTPPRLILSAPPADPARIDARIERSAADGPVTFGVLVCTEATQTPDCYLRYEPGANALDWLQLPPDDAVTVHLAYDRRDATP